MPPPLRVMSFNIRYDNPADGANAWPARRELALRTIRDADADVIGLQEVLASQAEEIKARFIEYEFVGVGRDDGAERGEMAPILFRRSRFQLVEGGHIWLSPDSRRPGTIGWDAACPRMATWVRLRFLSHPLNEITIVNTHWDHQGRAARRESARLMRRMAEALAGSPLILLGDFNCGPESSPYITLTRATGNQAELFDAHDGNPMLRRQGTYHGFTGRAESERIDWVLYNRRFELLDAAIVQEAANVSDGPQATGSRGTLYPSDHFPVMAKLRLLPASTWRGM